MQTAAEDAGLVGQAALGLGESVPPSRIRDPAHPGPDIFCCQVAAALVI